jgi:hypothetical protein
MAKTVVSVVVGYKERKMMNDWNDEKCQIKVEGRNKARNKTLNRRTRINTENYKNERRESQPNVHIEM